MPPRSTVLIPRNLAQRVDRYAAERGWAHGPGHRSEAVGHLLEVALAYCTEDGAL